MQLIRSGKIDDAFGKLRDSYPQIFQVEGLDPYMLFVDSFININIKNISVCMYITSPFS